MKASISAGRGASGRRAQGDVGTRRLLTGQSVPPAGWGVADATTALTSADNGPAGTTGLRPQAVRLEGSVLSMQPRDDTSDTMCVTPQRR
jgi:hypothetical protein